MPRFKKYTSCGPLSPLGVLLEEDRSDRLLTHREYAELIGISPGTLTRLKYDRENVGGRNLGTLDRVAKFLGFHDRMALGAKLVESR